MPPTVSAFNVRVPVPLKEWLTARAKCEDRSLNAQLIQIIKAAKRAEDGEAA